MIGFILYHKNYKALTDEDYGVNRLLEAAEEKGITLKVVSPEMFDLVVTRQDRKSILIEGKSTTVPDFVIPRMGSETTYFALAVIRQLEKLGVYCCNGSISIEGVKDKLFIHQALSQSFLPTPATMMVKFPIDIDLVKQEIGFPIVIKNIIGTRGEGIYLSESEDRFLDLMELIHSYNQNANIILQKFIKSSAGKDLRLFVIGDQVVGGMLRKSEISFKANYSKGGSVEALEITEEMKKLAVQTAHLFDLEIAGIDLLFTDNSFMICEANSAPDFEGLEKVSGKHIAEDILNHIIKKLQKDENLPDCTRS